MGGTGYRLKVTWIWAQFTAAAVFKKEKAADQAGRLPLRRLMPKRFCAIPQTEVALATPPRVAGVVRCSDHQLVCRRALARLITRG